MAPSPAGEGWGEENKINYLHFTYLISTFFLKGEGAGTCVDTYGSRVRRAELSIQLHL